MSEKLNNDKRKIFFSGSSNYHLNRLITSINDEAIRNQLYDILEFEHGQHLADIAYKEWAIARLKEIIDEWEVEHGNSLALIFENESRKIMLEELNNKLDKAMMDLEKDMSLAASVQRNFLYSKPPITKNYDIAFHFRPFVSVSGDYYDFYINNKNELHGLLLVDVSGHGIASSLLTVFTKPIFFRMFRDNPDLPIHHLLSKINRQLIEEMNKTENYLTAVLMRFSGHRVEYTNAAHPDIMLLKAKTGKCIRVKPEKRAMQGHMLGVGSIKYSFEPHEFEMEKGDALAIYSDCLIESLNEKREHFGVQNIMDVLEKASKMKSARGILSRLISGLNAHAGGVPLDDDLTVIVLKKL